MINGSASSDEGTGSWIVYFTLCLVFMVDSGMWKGGLIYMAYTKISHYIVDFEG